MRGLVRMQRDLMKHDLMNPDLTIQGSGLIRRICSGATLCIIYRGRRSQPLPSHWAVSLLRSRPISDRARPIKAMPIATVYDWTGLYIGGHARLGRRRPLVRANLCRQRGGHIGHQSRLLATSKRLCRWRPDRLQPPDRQLGSGAWKPIFRARRCAARPPSPCPTFPLITQTYDVSIDWTASLTGRLGYAWDRWMLYGKGGAAVMQETYALTAPGLVTPDSPYHRRQGHPARLDGRCGCRKCLSG